MKLQVTHRDVFGKKLRPYKKNNQIPGIIYAKHIDQSIPVFFEKNQFLKAYANAGKSTVVTLSGDNIDELVLIHNIEVNPVTNMLTHVDFLGVVKGQAVSAEVELKFIGESAVEKDKLGRIEYVLDTVTVTADPTKLPKEIEVDITSIATLHDVIFVRDLIIGKDITIETDPEQAVATAIEFSNEPLETENSDSDTDEEAAESNPENTDED